MAYEIGLGTRLYYGTAGMTAATEVTGVKKIEGPPLATGVVDVTPLNPTSRMRTFKAGANDPGVLKATVSFDGTLFATLHAIALAGTMKSWRITASDTGAATYDCDGFISEFSASPFELEGEMVFEMSVKWSGLPVFTA